jgi:hypothetical protein
MVQRESEIREGYVINCNVRKHGFKLRSHRLLNDVFRHCTKSLRLSGLYSTKATSFHAIFSMLQRCPTASFIMSSLEGDIASLNAAKTRAFENPSVL